MLVYNTTYNIDEEVLSNFLIWLHEVYVPEVEKNGILVKPRLLRVLSHRDENTECFSLQWEVESSALLHRWHLEIGGKLNNELLKMFGNKVVGFPTLLEVME
ncbi:DUF4286 family protein [uncultured Bacteroides sp.]|uniref:DUF4286 family protein n=1 Tax=uncultured Bacteroides sp. TaxID=162156 RepID=UPI002AAB4E85|nr:DUF4286 family protein [uncultured Bacteroides sp.]